MRQRRLAGFRVVVVGVGGGGVDVEQPVAGLFLLFQEGWALVSAAQTSS